MDSIEKKSNKWILTYVLEAAKYYYGSGSTEEETI